MSMRGIRARLQARARRAGLTLSQELSEELEAYWELLSRWNARLNLTSLDNREEAIDRLLIEPIIAARQLRGGTTALLDVGSGSGSPAIPLKLAVPKIALCMVESKTRKSAFLREAIRELALSDVRVETNRYEELLLRPDLHEAMNVVTIRAVRIEPKVLARLQAFVAPGGRLFLFRGPSGPDVPVSLVPPLAWQSTIPLVESLRSRLVIIKKGAVGPETGVRSRRRVS